MQQPAAARCSLQQRTVEAEAEHVDDGREGRDELPSASALACDLQVAILSFEGEEELLVCAWDGGGWGGGSWGKECE